MDSALVLRTQLLQAQRCEFRAKITADYADKTYTFAMSCRLDAHGNLFFTVLAPDSISGITGSVGDDGGKLTFDDQVLGFSLLAEERLSPVSGPWVMMRALRSGYIVSCSEGQIMLRDTYEEDAFGVEVWLGEDFLPATAQIYWQGCRILTIEVENFSIV